MLFRIFARLLFCIPLVSCAFAGTGKTRLPEKCSECGKQSTANPRRATPQNSDRLPAPAAAVQRHPLPSTVAQSPLKPQAPAPVTTCDPGGCWNTNGSRYNGGAANTYLDGNGKLCQRNGGWMQCF